MTLDAGIDVELPCTDCYGEPLARRRRAAGSSPPRRSTRQFAACCGRSSSSACSRSRTSTRRAAAASGGTPAQRDLARAIARKSLVLLRNDGTLPLSADLGSVAVIGPGRRRGAQPLRRLRVPGARRVAAGMCSTAATNRSRTSRSPGRATIADVDTSTRRACSTRSAARLGRPRAVRARLRRQRRVPRRLRRGGRARAVTPTSRSWCWATSPGLTEESHERREPRSRLARTAGRAGGSPAGRPRHRNPGRARARRREALRERGARAMRGGAARVASGRGGRSSDRGRAVR